jgi:5-(carboxyamino)imidazole ribonucleotide mutase
MAAHLAGVLASHTTLPVIGVPIKSGALNGADALYSTVQMPPGVPVATVGIDGAKNAAYLACEILSIKYPEITKKLENFRAKMRKTLEEKSKTLKKSKL